MNPTTLAFLLSVVVQQEKEEVTPGATAMRGGDAVEVSQFLSAPLRAIEWTGAVEAAFALIERYAANMTELNCPLQRRCDAADKALARCNRLGSLMNARYYAASAWLQLSQLHTLRGVDLSVVSMATIAVALPRLHTLSVFAYPPGVSAAAVAGSCEDLLPRLQDL
jgi:hypothetical protein